MFPWLTIEVIIYGLFFMLALALRLWQLGSYPLSDLEAQQSLLALDRSNLPAAGYYSPLLVSLNSLTFLLLGHSDVSARLASALLGMLLVVLPLTLRRLLGPRLSLLATALLAISPIAIYFSRTLNSDIGVAAGALMVFSGFFNWAADRRQRWLLLLAGGLALMLAAGSMVFSILIVFGLIILVQYPAFKALWLNQEGDSDRDENAPDHITSTTLEPNEANIGQTLSPDPQPMTPNSQAADWRKAGIFFLVALVLLSTAALFNLAGLSVLTGALPDWLSRFSFTPQPDAGFNAVFLLTIYEPLLVVAGLAGLAMTLVRRNLLLVSFSIWFVGLLILDILMAGRPPSHVVLLVVPLAFLAAFALVELGEGVAERGSWQNEGMLLLAGLAIAAFGYIGLTGWLYRICDAEDTFCQYAWLQAIAALMLYALMIIFFWYMNGAGTAIRGAALTGVVLGLLTAIGFGWRLNYGPLMYLPYQPVAKTPASTELVLLAETLADQSSRRVGDKTLLDVTLAGVNHPALQWQLRHFRHLSHETNLDSAPSAIITPPDDELGLGQAYYGQDFAVNATWSPVGLRPKALLKWLLYRQADEQPSGDKVVLWLRLEK